MMLSHSLGTPYRSQNPVQHEPTVSFLQGKVVKVGNNFLVLTGASRAPYLQIIFIKLTGYAVFFEL